MSEKVSLSFRDRNPDVLTSIANLSNDEVFTPPEFANKMLDTLAEAWASTNGGKNLWSDSTVTFLDPFTKSGVFLREVVRRLVDGLEVEIPDLQSRVNHVVSKQVFGIGITQLTSLLARRTVYCSKFANGKHSIATTFENETGNIWFAHLEHSWVGGKTRLLKADANGQSIETIVDGKCKFCGVSQKDYDRDSGLESHAYAFIHQEQTREFVSSIFGANVKFDVIIGNPPYQLSTEGHGVQAKPIYNLFVEQAKSLDPRFLCMVIPARWFSGGMGLSDFRQSMLNDSSLRVIEDFPDSSEVFPGTQIKGGVCYFLWDRDSKGDVRVTTHDKGVAISTAIRPLLEPGADVFIRFNEAIPILKKVMSVEKGLKNPELTLSDEQSFASLVSSIGAFGLDSTFRGKTEPSRGDLKVYRNGGVGYVDRESITKERSVIDKWKVFIPRAGSGSDSFPHSILGKPFVGEPGAISSWTYMHIGPFESEREAQNVISYISTKVFRFLVLLHKPTQDATRAVYTYVPKLDFSKSWTDEELSARYGLTSSEMEFIDSLIRPMRDADD